MGILAYYFLFRQLSCKSSYKAGSHWDPDTSSQLGNPNKKAANPEIPLQRGPTYFSCVTPTKIQLHPSVALWKGVPHLVGCRVAPSSFLPEWAHLPLSCPEGNHALFRHKVYWQWEKVLEFWKVLCVQKSPCISGVILYVQIFWKSSLSLGWIQWLTSKK